MTTKDEETLTIDGWFEEKVVDSLSESASTAYWIKKLQSLNIESRLLGDERQKYELVLDGMISGIYATLYDLTKVASNYMNPEHGHGATVMTFMRMKIEVLPEVWISTVFPVGLAISGF